jgi:preprotein translocase SecE subunit
VARDRQRAKQRQADRRDARIAARRAGTGPAAPDDAGAPPENVGRSDTVADSPPPAPILDGELEGDELDDDGEPGEIFEDELAPAPAGSTAGKPPRRGGSKVLGFLTACWAELQRVQWPDRRTLTQLTGIVLFFVVIAGAYLGALDAIFSRIIQAIL